MIGQARVLKSWKDSCGPEFVIISNPNEKKSEIPDFSFEKRLWGRGYKFVAGVDEVGRGAFAGSVVAACVVFPRALQALQGSSFKGSRTIKIDDSKKLTARQRERADKWIRKNCLAWGTGEAPVSIINRVGMGKATKIAFRKAIKEANRRLQSKTKSKIEFLLADAFFVPHVPGLPARRRKDKKGRFNKKADGKQLAIVNGDEESVSIAAASIVAKVYRDNLMLRLSRNPRYKRYGWERNKGYGTKKHREEILRHGITRLHRRMFVQTFLTNK